MTLTVEDGTIVTGANSYVSLATADAWFLELGYTLWATADASPNTVKEAALIRAAQYLRQKYRLLWKGSLVEADQAMDWPRRGVDVPDFFDPFYRQINVPLQFQDTYYIATDTIPQEVKEAQMLLAINVLDSTGAVTNSLQGPLGRKTKREKAGALEVEYMTAQDGGNTRMTTLYWDAEKMLEPYLQPSKPQTGYIVRS